MSNEDAFLKFFGPRMKTAPKITVPSDQMEIMRKFTEQKWKRKIQEYPQDARNIVDRNVIGILGEYAVLAHYGKTEYLDTSIGDSREYQAPDLWDTPKNKPTLPNPRIPVDVKTSRIGNVPLVKRGHKTVVLDNVTCQCPNIICVSNFKDVWLLGIASPTTLRKFVNDALIKNANNPDKTAFYGGDQLEDMPKTWEELRERCKALVEKRP